MKVKKSCHSTGRTLAHAIAITVLAGSALLAPLTAEADGEWHSSNSLIGTPKYKAGFKHFKWVNPNAPKGGTLRYSLTGSFDSLNHLAVQGDSIWSPIFGAFIYDSLMRDSLDESSTQYALIAEAVKWPSDYSSATYRLNKKARFHDGVPIKPEDIIFSFYTLKKVNPTWRAYYKNVVKAEKVGDHMVKFSFNQTGNRELPHILGQLLVLPKHYWEGIGRNGKKRDLSKSTLEPPLGSGPWKIGKVIPGQLITYERVKDYWAKDLPVNVGQWNFDKVQIHFFKDSTIAFEAFKAGKVDVRIESDAKKWSTGYKIAPVRDGKIKLNSYPMAGSKPMRALVFNTRRAKFADRRVRKALLLAFDFEWINKNLYFGLYKRATSHFENTELAAKGLPSEQELKLLEPLRGKIPDEVFSKAPVYPVYKSRRDFRKQLRVASKLLDAAGWSVKDGIRTNAKGEKFTIEFLFTVPRLERVAQAYARNLERLGIKTTIRVVESAQYVRRATDFDYDMIFVRYWQSESPGNEQRDDWGSKAADLKGSRNYAGIKNPAIDKIVDKIIFAKSRADLVTACHALDRILLWEYYMVPLWYAPDRWVASWSKLKRPDPGPSLTVRVWQTYWEDKEAAK